LKRPAWRWSDAIDGVDVVQALDAVEVALVHAIDADEARAALGRRRTAHANRRRLGPSRLAQHDALGAVAGAVAQVVQVPHRDRAEPPEARIAEDIALAAQHAGCRRS
jgi:hypothetical protein